MFRWFNHGNAEKDTYSPNKQIRCRFQLESGRLFYSVYKNDKPIVRKSALGFKIFGEAPLAEHFKLVREVKKKHAETIEMSWGEDHFIENAYNETAFYLSETRDPKRILTLRFRVFDNAVAFRYEIQPQPKFRQISIQEELTEFNVDPNSTAWKIPAYQPDRYEYNYEKAFVHELSHSVHTPLTLKTPNGYYLAIHEAAL